MNYTEAKIEVIKIEAENIMTLSVPTGGSGSGSDVNWGDL